MGELVEWLRAQLDELHAEAAGDAEFSSISAAVRDYAAQVLRDVEVTRRILDEHAAEVRSVEWWDAPITGKAAVCIRCAVAEPHEWNLPAGQAGVKPDGWVSAYVLAPCRTVRLVGAGLAFRPGYLAEWRP